MNRDNSQNQDESMVDSAAENGSEITQADSLAESVSSVENAQSMAEDSANVLTADDVLEQRHSEEASEDSPAAEAPEMSQLDSVQKAIENEEYLYSHEEKNSFMRSVFNIILLTSFYNFLFSRIRISTIILISSLMPLIAAGIWGSQILYDKVTSVEEIRRLERLTGLATSMSQLLYALMSERRVELGFRADNEEVTKQMLDDAYQAFDIAYNNFNYRFNQISHELTLDFINEQQGMDEGVRSFRSFRNTDDEDVSLLESYLLYERATQHLISGMLIFPRYSDVSSVTQSLLSYASFHLFLDQNYREDIIVYLGWDEDIFAIYQEEQQDIFNAIQTAKALGQQQYQSFSTEEENARFKELVANPLLVHPAIRTVKELLYGKISTDLAERSQWYQNSQDRLIKLDNFFFQYVHDLPTQRIEVARARAVLVRNLNVLIVAIILILVVSSVLRTTRYLIGSFRRLSVIMSELTKGNLAVAVPEPSQNEVGEMFRALHILKENAVEREKLNREKAHAQTLRQERVEYIEGLVTSFEETVSQVLGTIDSSSEQLRNTANTMQSTVKNTANAAKTAAEKSKQATSDVQQVVKAAENLAVSVRTVTEQFQLSSKVSRRSAVRAEEVDEVAQSLSDATNQISSVLGIIKDIAEQINLLALNATIESARAGEAGKGFAVVASEVKNLANQTSQSTEKIDTLVKDVQQITQEVLEILHDMKNAIGEVEQHSTQIVVSAEEQNTTTTQISSNMRSAASEVESIGMDINIVQENARDADQASAHVSQAVEALFEQSSLLSHAVNEFLAGIRHN